MDQLDALGHVVTVWRLGLNMPVKQFLEEEKWKPVYRNRLGTWGLSNYKVIATIIILVRVEELLGVIRMSPLRDFPLPEACRRLLAGADLPDHQLKAAGLRHLFLLSRHSGPRQGPPSPFCMVDAGE